MKINEKKIDDLNRELTIEVAAADYAEIERKKLADRRRTAEFKGFRKGMVPASLIKRVYGEQALVESVNQVIGQALDKHISDNKLRILGEPLASENQPQVEWTDGNDFTFVFDLGLSPEVNVEVEKGDTVPSYSVTVAAKDKAPMIENLKKYYEEHKEEGQEAKSDEDIEKEVTERLKNQYKNEAEWRLTKDIRDFYIAKAGVQLPEAFLKRWLLEANGGKVTAEDVEKDFPGFAEDFKWQLVRGSLMQKWGFKVEEQDLHEQAEASPATNMRCTASATSLTKW
jgi:FKBP-type peptidyl-prolyl cis-trans isomerase (trigger factor)